MRRSEPTRPQSPGVTRLEDVRDWLHVPTWMRAPLADSKRPIDGLWLVVGGDDALTVETASRLRARGGVVVVVREGHRFAASDDGYLVRPAADEDYEALFRDLRKRRVWARGVVHLWNVGRPSAEEPRRRRASPAFASWRSRVR